METDILERGRSYWNYTVGAQLTTSGIKIFETFENFQFFFNFVFVEMAIFEIEKYENS